MWDEYKECFLGIFAPPEGWFVADGRTTEGSIMVLTGVGYSPRSFMILTEPHEGACDPKENFILLRKR